MVRPCHAPARACGAAPVVQYGFIYVRTRYRQTAVQWIRHGYSYIIRQDFRCSVHNYMYCLYVRSVRVRYRRDGSRQTAFVFSLERVQKFSNDAKVAVRIHLYDIVVACAFNKVRLALQLGRTEAVQLEPMRHVDDFVVGAMHDQDWAADATNPTIIWEDVEAGEGAGRCAKARDGAEGRR